MNRRAVDLAVLGASFCAVANGQAPGVLTANRFVRVLQERDLVPRPTTIEPVLTQGKLPARDPRRNELRWINSKGDLQKRGQEIVVDGSVEFDYKGYKIFADHVTGNPDTSEFQLDGNVKVIGEDAVVTGESIWVNLNQRSFVAKRSNAILHHKLTGGDFKRDIFLKGAVFRGDEHREFGTDSDFTTCELPNPHFDIRSRSSDLIRGDRAILRGVDFYVFGHKRLSIPYLYIPLREHSDNYLPQVGQSPDEGYYIKNRIAIPLHDQRNHLDARVDYMTKLGTGLGTDFSFLSKRIGGLLNVYTVVGRTNNLNLNYSHRQEMGWAYLTFDSTYQKNNYLSASNSTLATIRGDLAFKPSLDGSATRLSFARSLNSSVGYESLTENVGLSDHRNIGKTIKTNLDVIFSDTKNSSGGSSTSREQVDVRFHGEQDIKQATASLEIQKTVPIGTSAGAGLGGSDRFPALSLTTDSRKLYGEKTKALPFRAELSFGDFSNSTNTGKVGRYYFDYSVSRIGVQTGRFHFDTTAEFKQGVYTDNTAQYSLFYNNVFSYSLGKDTSANLRYNYSRPYGFTPLQIDKSYYVHQATMDLSYRAIPKLLIGAQTGYDIARLVTHDVPWQQIGLRSEYGVRDKLLIRSLATYDTIKHLWSNYRLDLTSKGKHDYVALGTRFDGYRHTFSNANLSFDGLQTGKSTVGMALTYNGYSKRFDQRQLNVVYDLHCWEAVFAISNSATGFRSGTEMQFFLRLKGFSTSSLFGSTRRGEPINYGSGSQ